MKIQVEYDVPYAKGEELTCYTGNGDFWGREICGFVSYRDRTHGNKAPVERHIPKCALFNEWLRKNGMAFMKCDKCLNAIEKARNVSESEVNYARKN